ncbi:MAG: methionyl-tRNA formyltransferase [Dehalococcoidia bacterium]|nr:methionyl-tRNA formyltransferase [Dehalococcoidia bacterium]
MTDRVSRIVFMGSPQFAVPSLQALVAAGHELVMAVTQPDRPAGRGGRLHPPPVKVAAEALGIPVFQPETLRDAPTYERLRAAEADVFVVAAYGKILPQAVLGIPRRGCLNVHASLLPKWRGPSPIVASILAGEDLTGVSIMELVRKMDAGPVISRIEVPILSDDSAASLEPRLAALGAEELVRVLPGWVAGERIPRAQDEAEATYCHLIAKHDGWLRAEMTAAGAERAVRAFNPWPGAFVMYGEHRLSVWQARVASGEPAPAGTLQVIEKAPAIALAEGWLVLEEVQRPGGKRLSAAQFIAGERGNLLPEAGLG